MNTMIINGNRILSPIPCKNFLSDGEPKFKHKPRKGKLTHLVLHETAGNSASQCKNTLLKKGYGVHLILDRDGTLTQHNDLMRDNTPHAKQLNDCSIGVEIVNPYAPKLCKLENYETIPAKWWTWCPDKNDRRYVMPTDIQMDIIKDLIPFLCDVTGIPFAFPTWYLNKKQPRIKNWQFGAKPNSGIVAHQDFSKHSDGRYILEYLILEHLVLDDLLTL